MFSITALKHHHIAKLRSLGKRHDGGRVLAVADLKRLGAQGDVSVRTQQNLVMFGGEDTRAAHF